MKVCIESSPIGLQTTDKGGVYRYIWNLIESLSRIDGQNEYTLFFNFFRKEHCRALQQNIKNLKVGDNFSVRISRFPVRVQNLLEPPAEFLTGRFDVFHGCFDYMRPVMFGKGVVTIHDIRYLENIDNDVDENCVQILKESTSSPDFYIRDHLNREKLFRHLRSTIKKTVQRADIVITVSEFSKKRITDVLGIAPEKVKVIYHGIDSQFAPVEERVRKDVLRKFGIDKPYVFYAGKYDPLKNIGRLLEAFQKVMINADVRLVMAGPANWYYYVIREKACRLNIADNIVFTDFVTDAEITALYSAASVFASPSLYEGFGLTFLEAMACGTPIVASKVCSIPEITGNAAVYADPYSSEDIAEKILQCLEYKNKSTLLKIEGKRRAQSFSWENTALKTQQVYSEVCRRD